MSGGETSVSHLDASLSQTLVLAKTKNQTKLVLQHSLLPVEWVCNIHKPDIQPCSIIRTSDRGTIGTVDQQNSNCCLFVLFKFVTLLYTFDVNVEIEIDTIVNS